MNVSFDDRPTIPVYPGGSANPFADEVSRTYDTTQKGTNQCADPPGHN